MKTFILSLFFLAMSGPSYSAATANPSATAPSSPATPLSSNVSSSASSASSASSPSKEPARAGAQAATVNEEASSPADRKLSAKEEATSDRDLALSLSHSAYSSGNASSSGQSASSSDPSSNSWPSDDESHFVEFGLEYPINFGIHLKYRLSKSIYSRWGLSFMPEFFLSSFTSLAPSFGSLSEDQARLISDTFANSIYLDFRMAWAPYLHEFNGGPYMELGLAGLFYGKGKLESSQISKAIQGISNSDLKTDNYSVKTNAYALTAHVGYQIPFREIKLNIETGIIKIFGASILSVPTITASEELNPAQKKQFKKFLIDKGWIFPTISMWIGFGF